MEQTFRRARSIGRNFNFGELEKVQVVISHCDSSVHFMGTYDQSHYGGHVVRA